MNRCRMIQNLPKSIFSTLVIFTLAACGGNNNSNQVPNQAQDPEIIKPPETNSKQNPVLSSLTKEGKLAIGSTLTAKSTCEDCVGFNTVYKWTVDRNDNAKFGDTIEVNGQKVSDTVVVAEQYSISEDDFGHQVRLEAYLINRDSSQKTKTEFVNYQPVFVKELSTVAFGRSYAVKTDGTLLSWEKYSSASIDQPLDNVKKVVKSSSYHIALNLDHTLTIWSDSGLPTEKLKQQLPTDVKDVFANSGAFAVIKNDDTIVVFGDEEFGGQFDQNVDRALFSGVKKLVHNNGAFLALTKNNSAIVWGSNDYGADDSRVHRLIASGNTKDVYASGRAFAALLNNDTAVIWGKVNDGATEPMFKLIPNVKSLYLGYWGAVVLTKTGDIEAWGLEENSIAQSFQLKDRPSDITELFIQGNLNFASKSDGTLYQWQKKIDKDGRIVPPGRVIPGLFAEKVVAMNSYSVSINSDGEVSFIDGTFAPSVIEDIQSAVVKDIQMNDDYVIIIQKDGSLFQWFSISSDLTPLQDTSSNFLKFVGPQVAQLKDGSLVSWKRVGGSSISAVEDQLQATEMTTSSLD